MRINIEPTPLERDHSLHVAHLVDPKMWRLQLIMGDYTKLPDGSVWKAVRLEQAERLVCEEMYFIPRC